jgi:alpha-glucosidase
MYFSSGPDFGINPRVIDHSIKEYSSMIYPAVPHKDAAIKDEFVQLTLTFKNKYQFYFRAYNDAVAYKFVDKGSINRNVMSDNLISNQWSELPNT